MPSGDAEKIRFAPDGMIYLAPTGGGLVLPTEVGDGVTAPTGFKALGYVSDAGVTITPAITTTPLNAWQSAVPVLYNVDSASFQLSATLIEANKLVTESFFGASWIASLGEDDQPNGEYRLDLSSMPDLAEFAIVVDWKYKTNLWRATIGRAMVTERGAITLQRTQNQAYELTINALDNDGNLGYIFTNEAMTA